MSDAQNPHADDARLALALATALLAAEAAGLLRGGDDGRPSPAFAPHLVDVNSACTGELEALPGVGRVLAERIVAARPFASADELGRVPGLGATTLERVRRFTTCGSRAPDRRR